MEDVKKNLTVYGLCLKFKDENSRQFTENQMSFCSLVATTKGELLESSDGATTFILLSLALSVTGEPQSSWVTINLISGAKSCIVLTINDSDTQVVIGVMFGKGLPSCRQVVAGAAPLNVEGDEPATLLGHVVHNSTLPIVLVEEVHAEEVGVMALISSAEFSLPAARYSTRLFLHFSLLITAFFFFVRVLVLLLVVVIRLVLFFLVLLLLVILLLFVLNFFNVVFGLLVQFVLILLQSTKAVHLLSK